MAVRDKALTLLDPVLSRSQSHLTSDICITIDLIKNLKVMRVQHAER